MPVSHRHGHALKLHRSEGFGEVSIGGQKSQLIENAALPKTGIGVAINTLTLGVRPKPVKSRHRGQRGGARNRADRASDALTSAQVRNLLEAAAHAQRIGLPFTRMFTVHWQAAGVPLAAMPRATGHFLDLLTKAIQRHGSRTAWLFVHESGAGKGAHCHLFAHIPDALAPLVARRQRSWIKRITAQAYRPRAIKSRPIIGASAGDAALYATNLAAAVEYLLKGADPVTAARYGLTRLEAGGRISGKRCGTSQNIGPKARKEGDAKRKSAGSKP